MAATSSLARPALARARAGHVPAARPARRRAARCSAAGGDEDATAAEPAAVPAPLAARDVALGVDDEEDRTALSKFLFPDKEELPDDVEMSVWDHLDELRERVIITALFSVLAMGGCFVFAKPLIVFLEAPVLTTGVRFLQLSPGEFCACACACGFRNARDARAARLAPPPPPFPRSRARARARPRARARASACPCLAFSDRWLAARRRTSASCPDPTLARFGRSRAVFTSLKTAGYCGILLGSPVILYEAISYIVPGLTVKERQFLGPIVLGSSVLFYVGVCFAYAILTPAALNFFISYADGAVESLWSIDQYFEFVLVLLFSTGLSFQVPVVQVLLGSTGVVSSETMLSVWRYVIVGAVTAAAVLTPSTDPLTQCLLAGPLIGLYFGGAYAVKALEAQRGTA